jgi:hypothetical protein
MAMESSFKVNTVFGGYDGQSFDSAKSPVMIWELIKSEA